MLPLRLSRAGLTALLASLSLTACTRAPMGPTTVRLHVGANAPRVTLYEVDPAKPSDQRIQPVCEAPCARSVDVAGRLFFFEGDPAPKSLHFEIEPRAPDVTIVAHAGSRPLRHWGIATTVLGAATIPAGYTVLFLGAWQSSHGDATRGIVAGLVMMTLGVFGTIAGVSMIDYAKTTFDIRDGAPSFRAGRVRLDGGGLAVEF